MSLPGGEIPIVLTATIVPNQTGSAVTDPAVRRAEYIAAIAFYRQFSPVYFLENSIYPLERDAKFNPAKGFFVRRFPPSNSPERGKGFQEFEMLDAWVRSEEHLPSCWIKISGRYQVHNIATLIRTCARRPSHCPLFIDQLGRVKFARTYLFFVESEYYHEHLLSLYRDCDDRQDAWIERAMYRVLREDTKRAFASFPIQPRISAVAGSTGYQMRSGQLSFLVKCWLRFLNRLVDRRYLWYQSRA